MGRDRHQNGSVEKTAGRTKKWKGHWYEYETVDGKETRHHRSCILGLCSEMTKGAARDKLREIIRAAESAFVPAERQTVQQFIDATFLPGRSWEANTKANYASVLKLHILPALGKMPLADVRKAHIVAALKGMCDAGMKHGSIDVTRRLLHTIFSEAEDNKLIDDNPSRKVKNPARLDRTPKAVLSLTESRHLIGSLSGRTSILFRLLLGVGLRIGEALALRWSDIQPDGLLVDESADRTGSTKPTKTDTPRIVPLTPDIRVKLAAMRETTYFGGDQDFIFGMPVTGALMRRQSAETFLDEARAASGLGLKLTFRICRRTFATLAKAHAQPRDIQAMLGHTTAMMTETYYIQPVAESQQQAAVALETSLVQ
jgi:integrase